MLQRILSAILLAMGLMASGTAFAAEEVNRLELPQKIEVEKGTTELRLPILLTNADKIAGFQCDLYLPDGFSVATDEYDDYLMDVARTTTKRHSLATRQMSDGALRIVLSSMTNATFSGNSGAVLNITVKVGDNITAGSYNVNLKNVVLTDPNAARYTSADVTGTIVVNKAEGSGSEDNKLELQEEITIEKGTTEIELPILLTNKDKIAGFQCDLYLPDGFSVATDEYDDYLMDVARTTTKRHSLATRQMSDGSLRIVLSSMTNATFSGNSGAVLNITVKISDNVAVGSYNVNLKNIVLTDPDAARYTSAGVTGTILVKEAEQPVTVTAQNLTMVYGDNVPSLIYQTEGAELKGTPSLFCEATSTSPVGSYPIVVTQGSVTNKKVTYVNGTLTITKAPLTVSVGNYTRKQGEENPEFTLTYDGFKNNETEDVLTKKPTATTTANVSSEPGEYEIVVSGGESENYSLSYRNGKLMITDADPVKVTAKSYTREYGDANPTFEYTVEGAALEGEPEIICEATATSPVGEYPIVIKKGSVANYNDTYVNGVLTITKAPLTISAGNYTKKQGEENPEFALTYKGFKNDETKDVLTKQPSVVCKATAASAPGEYDVTVSGAEAKNYDISYVNGKLTVVNADAIIITAKSYTREYGDANPSFEYTSEGAALDGEPEIICEATATSPVGEYPIVIKKGSVSNYNDTYVNGVLTITKAPLKISVGNYEKKQYDPMPEFTVAYDGFKNNETEDVLSKQPVITCKANEDSAPGEYDITLSGAEAGNYTMKYVAGKLTVTEPDSYTLTYMVDGKEYQSFSIKYREAITPLEVPEKEGYTFSGWSEIPETMPANDVVVKGYFTINSYTITYVLDGEVYTTETLEYGAKIVPPVIPGLEDYSIWEDVPATMPAGDITIYGKAKDIIDSIEGPNPNPSLVERGTIYDTSGRKLPALQKGLNIIRMKDGTVKKVMIK